MKKVIFTSFLLLASFAATAQTYSDVTLLSETNYYGTARSIALGNAVTALGGDLGTIGINPAGAAVSPFSQFTISPGVTVSVNGASYAPSRLTTEDPVYGLSGKTDKTVFTVPNVGFNLVLDDTFFEGSLRRATFGFVVNTVNNSLNSSRASGYDDRTSYSGYLATMANTDASQRASGHMLPGDIFASPSPFDEGYYWDYVMAYGSRMINFNALDNGGRYYGSAEGKFGDAQSGFSYGVPGTLRHISSIIETGARSDLIMNFALDFDDSFYLGFNLGIPVMSYKYTEVLGESAVNPGEFPVTPENINGQDIAGQDGLTYFESGLYSYRQNIDASGIYAKIGAIWTPVAGLRLGAAFQTPSLMEVEVSSESRMRTTFNNPMLDGEADSPDTDFRYNFTTPLSFNVGAAYTLANLGFFSIDYELADYGVTRYSAAQDEYGEYLWGDNDQYYRVNRLNELFYGVSHQLRAGVEIRVTPALSLRGGYTLKTDPRRIYEDNVGPVDAYVYDMFFDEYESGMMTIGNPGKMKDCNTKSWSVGLGYSSPGSFFSDIAFRRISYPTDSYSVFGDYMLAEHGSSTDILSPTVERKHSLTDIVFTFGWRF